MKTYKATKLAIRCNPVILSGYEGPGFVIVSRGGSILWGTRTIAESTHVLASIAREKPDYWKALTA